MRWYGRTPVDTAGSSPGSSLRASSGEQRRCVVVRVAHLSHLPRPGVNDDRSGRAAPPASACGRRPTPAFSVPAPAPEEAIHRNVVLVFGASHSLELRGNPLRCAAPVLRRPTSTHRARSSGNATVTFSMAILQTSTNPKCDTESGFDHTRPAVPGQCAPTHAPPPRPAERPPVLRLGPLEPSGSQEEKGDASSSAVGRSVDGGVRRRGGAGAGGRAGGAGERGDDRAARSGLRRARAGRRRHRGAGRRGSASPRDRRGSTTGTATCSSATSPATASSGGTPTGPSATS